MSKLYFIVGSQDLYGEETLRQAADIIPSFPRS